jgi:maleate isomerase
MTWMPDGWDATVRIGVLTPHADVGPESELRAMAPTNVGIHAARVPFGAMSAGGAMDRTIPLAPVKAFAEPPHVDDAAALLSAAPLHAIGYAFTSSAYVLGIDGEARMIERLTARTRGIPVVAACAAVLSALEALGVGRVALYDPPWFDRELNALGAEYYRSAKT